jgi:exosortase C (VPDSG-CTERM-specific)
LRSFDSKSSSADANTLNLPEIRTDADSSSPTHRVPNDCHVNRKLHARWVGVVLYVALVSLAFANSLLSLIGYAARTPLFSYILWVPFCSAFLIYIQRKELPKDYVCSPFLALFPLVLGLSASFVGFGSHAPDRFLNPADYFALIAFSLICFVIGGGFLFLGGKWMAAAAFPIAFLLFMIPLPDRALNWIEISLQAASAEAADLLFSISGMPVSRDGLFFELPGFSMKVAQECSGVQASWVLFVSAVLASYLFLKSPWRRIVLVLVIVPLGILRNGFRIVVIGLLCVRVGPHMIDSAIHRRGGPLFLLLSLIPLSVFLWWLRKGEILSRSSHERSKAKAREQVGAEEGKAGRQQA